MEPVQQGVHGLMLFASILTAACRLGLHAAPGKEMAKTNEEGVHHSADGTFDGAASSDAVGDCADEEGTVAAMGLAR